MTAAGEPSSVALERALDALGLRCAVEVRGRLAVLRAGPGADLLADPSVRARVVALAREHGFTHAALELEY